MRSMLASLRQRYAEWRPADDDPPATAAADARLLEAHCAPADPRWLAIELKRTVDALRPAPKGIDEGAASDAMMEALEDAPVDIAEAALKRVRMECKWFPKPAEIRDRVVAELGERKRAAVKARVAADMAARRKPASPPRPATEAEKAGLVARVIPADQLLEETLKAATTIASYSLPVVMMIKEAVNRAFEGSLNEGLLFERRAFHSAFALEDQKEGMAAFVEKRKPAFKNR